MVHLGEQLWGIIYCFQIRFKYDKENKYNMQIHDF